MQSDGKAEKAREQALVERERARVKALGHPLRLRIFGVFAEREACPKELAEEFGEPLHNVMYHVDWLAGKKPANKVQLIELVDLDRKHGGPQHIYRAIDRPYINSQAALGMSRASREDSTEVVVPLVLSDIKRARKAGTFDDHPLRSVMRQHEELDDQGMREAAEAVEAYFEVLGEIAGRSKNRIANGEDGFPVAMQALIFPVEKLY